MTNTNERPRRDPYIHPRNTLTLKRVNRHCPQRKRSVDHSKDTLVSMTCVERMGFQQRCQDFPLCYGLAVKRLSNLPFALQKHSLMQVARSSGHESPIAVPDHPLARLMFYLYCISSAVGYRFLQNYITRFAEHDTLSPAQRRAVLEAADGLSPKLLVGKIIFEHESEGHTVDLIDGLSVDTVSLPTDIFLLGFKLQVRKVLVCHPNWLQEHFTRPMTSFPGSLLLSMHCIDCKGAAGYDCSCIECPRFGWSLCAPPRAANNIVADLPAHPRWMRRSLEVFDDPIPEHVLPFSSTSNWDPVIPQR